MIIDLSDRFILTTKVFPYNRSSAKPAPLALSSIVLHCRRNTLLNRRRHWCAIKISRRSRADGESQADFERRFAPVAVVVHRNRSGEGRRSRRRANERGAPPPPPPPAAARENKTLCFMVGVIRPTSRRAGPVASIRQAYFSYGRRANRAVAKWPSRRVLV